MLTKTRIKIVVVGAGAAGVFTAYLLKKHAPDRFEITILEKHHRVGGNARSHREHYDGEEVNIDSGAQFFSKTAQPDYTAMLHEEGFFAQGVVQSYNVGATVWNRSKNNTAFLIPAELLPLLEQAVTHIDDWVNFLILTLAAIERYCSGDWTETFGVWIDKIPFVGSESEKAAFKTDIARPFMYQFALVPPDQLDRVSARFAAYYFVRSLPWDGGPSLFSVDNSTIGLDGIQKALLAKYGLTVRLDTPVRAVRPDGGGYIVTTDDGSTLQADELVFATPPPATLAMLPVDAPFEPVRKVLRALEYIPVPVLVQRNHPLYMPGDTNVWSASNVIVVDKAGGIEPSHYMLSVWFGPLRHVPIGKDFFKSWGNPELVPYDSDPLITQMHHLMVGTPEFIQQRQWLRSEHQGRHHMWFAGGYILDYDSQNASLKAATDVAADLITRYAPEARAPVVLPEPTFQRRPELLRTIERKLVEVAPDHPAVRALRERPWSI